MDIFNIFLILIFGIVLIMFQVLGEKVLKEMLEKNGKISTKIFFAIIIAEIVALLIYVVSVFKILSV